MACTRPTHTSPQDAARTASSPIPGWLSKRSVLLACLATFGAHLVALGPVLGSDEGGFAMVARYWRDGGPFLYGPQWVDRPPGLIAVFDAADHLGTYGVRLTAGLVAVLTVAAVSSAAGTVGGAAGARFAGWTAFAFSSSLMLGAQALDGELIAAAFVALAMAGVLRAVRTPGLALQHVMVLGAASGVCASVAVLVKQNFVDGFVFAGVLVAVGLLRKADRTGYRPRTLVTTLVSFLLGACAPMAAAVLWAAPHGGPAALLEATYGFRAAAAAVMATWSWDAPLHRLEVLALVGVLSGLLVLVGHLAITHRRRLAGMAPLPWAVAATATVEVVGIVGGQNFWRHYLIALVPTAALAAGVSSRRGMPGRRWTARIVATASAVTLLSAPFASASAAAGHDQEAYVAGRWIGASASHKDTMVVLYSHPNVIEAAGLEPGYPYAWSLPVRTLDPQLSLLARTLGGQMAPTWVVRWDDAHEWGLDRRGRVAAALKLHYQQVAAVCGHPTWLHKGLVRRLAPLPSAADCGGGAA